MLYSDNDVTHNYLLIYLFIYTTFIQHTTFFIQHFFIARIIIIMSRITQKAFGALRIFIVVLVQNNPTLDFTYLLFKPPMFLHSNLKTFKLNEPRELTFGVG